MSSSTTVPLSITPEAAARIAELGIQADLDRVFEHLRQTVSGLCSLKVILVPPYDTGEDPFIVIDAYRDVSFRSDGQTWNLWCKWAISTFPPQVLQHFSVLFHYGAEHAG